MNPKYYHRVKKTLCQIKSNVERLYETRVSALVDCGGAHSSPRLVDMRGVSLMHREIFENAGFRHGRVWIISTG